jgi:hypothetical protein
MTNKRRFSPICGAARPTPSASYIVSNISAHRAASSSSNFGHRLADLTENLRGIFCYFSNGHKKSTRERREKRLKEVSREKRERTRKKKV